MLSIVSFISLWRHRKQERRLGSEPLVLGTQADKTGDFGTELFSAGAFPEDYDPATANDFSYEDALLDSQIRAFMQDEYRQVAPPEGIFQRLTRVLRNETVTQQVTAISRRERIFVGLYRAFSGQTLSRMVPGGIAVAVLIVVGIGSSTSSLVRSGQLGALMSSTPESTQVVSTIFMPSPDQQPITIIHTEANNVQSGVDVTMGEEAFILIRGGIAYNLPTDKMKGTLIETVKFDKDRLTPF